MRIFVTGGTGFLGSHFLNQAWATGHEVLALRRSGSQPWVALIHEPTWIENELDQVSTQEIEGCDALVHFASHGVSPQPSNWQRAMAVNVCQSMALLERAEAAGIPRLLLCGSCLEFGRSAERYDFIPPDAPLEPIGPYASSKAAFAFAATAFARTASASLVMLRPFQCFGEGQHQDNLWPSLRRAALAGRDYAMTPGEQIRDFQPVEETVAAFLQTLAAWPGRSGAFHQENVGSGQPTSLRDFAEYWWRHWGATGTLQLGALPYRKGEIMRVVPHIH
jgi:nucleoside-diphosphate-sugar epimerase